MAMHGFRGLGWLLCSVIVAPTCYMVTSHGAAERARLRGVEAAIVAAHKEIRGLETEFETRANLAQIERWNGDVLAMNAPAPQQYLASATGLAALDQPSVQPATVPAETPRVETAALIIPTGMRPIQPVAAKAVPASAPAAASGQPNGVVRVARQEAARPDGELNRLMQKVDRSKLAMADRPLLSASTMNDLRRVAQREQLALH
ncbi:hypothetical protein ACNFJ7_00325 [Sphingomonas sp. HT-1]|uniref:hypothetical protein n=1 Tax=unclassified Sphingomonas TaxID=196159 RepID=UPI0002D9A373|nr:MULTISPECIES: hypothetical protein [unclassified Sphingomonas]KTF67587.1 hypothetical protein ATB93_02330 [Sphingomonas sp. WG]